MHRPEDTWHAQPLQKLPAEGASVMRFTLAELRQVRETAAAHAEQAGLRARERADLVLAVGELASNSIRHAGGGGELRVWSAEGTVICEVHDAGRIAGPPVGQAEPDRDSLSGRGLWLVRKLCERVQIHSGERGTTVRIRMRPVRRGA